MFVKTKIEDAIAVKNPFLKRSVLGKKILDYGIISIDYIHQKIYFQPFDMVPIPEAEAKVTETKVEDGKLNPITRQFFLEHIFDYRKGNDFVYNGAKPVVIDFWATWCGPCMRLLPEMEKLAEKYKGKVILYDYKTDYVPSGNENTLIDKYRIQLELYKKAVERSLGRNVDEVYIYSFFLDKALKVF